MRIKSFALALIAGFLLGMNVLAQEIDISFWAQNVDSQGVNIGAEKILLGMPALSVGQIMQAHGWKEVSVNRYQKDGVNLRIEAVDGQVAGIRIYHVLSEDKNSKNSYSQAQDIVRNKSGDFKNVEWCISPGADMQFVLGIHIRKI